MPVRQKNLSEILTQHRQRYPLMEPADYGKLLFQNEFGPEHIIESPEQAGEYLLREWAQAAAGGTEAIEDIGNHLYRFHLTDAYDIRTAAPLLAKLLFLTARRHYGTMEGLTAKLSLLQEWSPAGLEPWLTDYIRAGCPALHHSEAFRKAYAPHYRLLRDVYAIYFPIIYQVQRHLSASGRAVIAIDGPCGSGKSSLASLLAELFPSRILHMDDYYLPLPQRSPGWEQIPCENMDLHRFLQEALLPAARGEEILYRPYSCREGRLSEPRRLPASPLTIVEGSYSHHPLLAPHYDRKVFLTCQRQEQLSRLARREKSHLDAYLQRWIPLEEAYYRAYLPAHIQTFLYDTAAVSAEAYSSPDFMIRQGEICFDNTPFFQ